MKTMISKIYKAEKHYKNCAKAYKEGLSFSGQSGASKDGRILMY